VPAQAGAVNDGERQNAIFASSFRRALARTGRTPASIGLSVGRPGGNFFAPDEIESPAKRRFWAIYRKRRQRFDRRRAKASSKKPPSNRPRNPEQVAPMDSSHLAQHAGTAGALFASVFVVATTTMRTMIPLRVFGILTNLVLIATATAAHSYLVILVQLVVLTLNSYRLHQMLQLVRDVKRSVSSDLSMDWLKPFMTERKCESGEVLFYKDEKADSMYYIVSGRYRLVESGIELPVGAIVGEFGMVSPSNVRTQTLECAERGTILSVSYHQVEQLYVQNPAFGFYFLKLVTARLFENINRLEKRLAHQAALAKPS
jgi:hypothetical protein